jgi:hypothetical protein
MDAKSPCYVSGNLSLVPGRFSSLVVGDGESEVKLAGELLVRREWRSLIVTRAYNLPGFSLKGRFYKGVEISLSRTGVPVSFWLIPTSP